MTTTYPHRLSHPRIYGVPLSFPLSLDQWQSVLDRCVAMHFSHVLVSFASCGMNSPEADSMVSVGHLAEVIRLGRQRDIDVLLDVSQPIGMRLVTEFDGLSNELPDPRGTVLSTTHTINTLDAPETAENILVGLLRDCLQDGLAGFCLRCIDVLPIAGWRKVMQQIRQIRDDIVFLAWTPGLPRAEMVSIARSDIDGVFLSSCWWDMKASWLMDEYADLRSASLLMTMPDVPWGARVLDAIPAHQRTLAAHRALAMAMWLGDGVLIPLGFEKGWPSTAIAGMQGPNALMKALENDDVVELREAIKHQNICLAKRRWKTDMLRRLTGPGAPMAVFALAFAAPAGHDDIDAGYVMAVNPSLDASARMAVSAWAPYEYTQLQPLRLNENGAASEDGAMPAGQRFFSETVTLGPGELKAWRATCAAPVLTPMAGETVSDDATAATAAVEASRASRLVIESMTPCVERGRFAVKRVVGQSVGVEADILIDGHDVPSAVLLWRPIDATDWREVTMLPLSNDRWRAEFTPDRIGRHEFTVEAWRDPYVNWCTETSKKHDAGLDVALELQEAAQVLRDVARHTARRDLKRTLRKAAGIAADTAVPAVQRLTMLVSNPIRDAVAAARYRPFCIRLAPVQALDVEPPIAAFASWYELFPRSQSGDVSRHGTFDDVIRRLPAIRDMGFDVLYFPPIHPIGETHRKGRNNSPAAQAGDPGSPYAIGSEQGGHDAIHPLLGTLDDFHRLNQAARAHGLSLALDFAVQCSPDHPWLKAHPGWFDWRPDGSLRYAENPPKKYEDIVNVDFYAKEAVPDLWLALRDVVLFWIAQGVTLFRVDNPHTKPLPFWEWLIASVRGRHPEVVFLSEAFTRPKMMYRLAKIGFSQSYTYFTWRHTKWEFIEYMRELTQGEMAAYFRPNFFVNTPDINPVFLQQSGRAGFLIRAALATTLSGSWGMYNGFELCEANALPGREEYLDSEKYQLRAWDWSRSGNIVREITQLNRVRRAHPALQSHLGVTFYNAFDEHILYFGKATPARDDVVLVAINLDPYAIHEADCEIPLWEWGLPDHAALAAENLFDGTRLIWHGKRQRLRLTPDMPFALWSVVPATHGDIS